MIENTLTFSIFHKHNPFVFHLLNVIRVINILLNNCFEIIINACIGEFMHLNSNQVNEQRNYNHALCVCEQNLIEIFIYCEKKHLKIAFNCFMCCGSSLNGQLPADTPSVKIQLAVHLGLFFFPHANEKLISSCFVVWTRAAE